MKCGKNPLPCQAVCRVVFMYACTCIYILKKSWWGQRANKPWISLGSQALLPNSQDHDPQGKGRTWYSVSCDQHQIASGWTLFNVTAIYKSEICVYVISACNKLSRKYAQLICHTTWLYMYFSVSTFILLIGKCLYVAQVVMLVRYSFGHICEATYCVLFHTLSQIMVKPGTK